jgi:dolichyl-phosphate beta-glucosyltransferase
MKSYFIPPKAGFSTNSEGARAGPRCGLFFRRGFFYNEVAAPGGPDMTHPNGENVFLSVVVPAYDEEERIGPSLAAIGSYLGSKPFSSEVIVVDDGSGDRTAEVARDILRSVPRGRIMSREENVGKGHSVREGVLAAAGEVILFSDADLSTPITELDKFLPRLERGDDVVIGSRALADSVIEVRQSRPRETMGKAFNLLVRMLVLRGFRDTQCGFKAFRRAAAMDLFSRLRTTGFAFDVEILMLARRLGYRVAEVPVVWRNSPSSRVRLVRSSWRMLRELLKIRTF